MITISFVVLSLALAFAQKPGWATSDTKIDLHVDPGRFLSQVASVWAPTTDLGEVHSAQYSGYLWPMGPFFAALHQVGIGAWVVQRLWLALMYALAVWGILRLFDALLGRPRGAAHVVGAAFFLLNPYVVVFTARTTITLLGYAVLPWLLLVTHHGVHAARERRSWRPWWWAAAFALIFTSSGGGVNAAVVGWMLVGPLVLLFYEPAVGNVRWRDSGSFLVRASALGVLASLWWIVPLLVHVHYGIDFLQFTEQPASIWGTNSSTEVLRLMGYWTSYIGVGYGVTRPFFSDGGTLLFSAPVVGASLLLSAFAVVGFARARRQSYAPFLLLLVVVGAVIEVGGFPDGTPLRSAMNSIYYHIFVLRFLRTTNKAAPLIALGLSGLLGLGAQAAFLWLRKRRAIRIRRVALVAAPLALATLIVLGALPMVRGGALDTQLLWKRIPPAWVSAGKGLGQQLPQNTRALVLPGQIFAYYTWGGTIDPILPRLTARPVAVRSETPYSNLHAVDLLTTVDDLVQQARLVPGELTPLLRLMGVGAVVTGSDDDISRSGAIDPAAAARVLGPQLGASSRSYGPLREFPPASGDLGNDIALPEVRRYDISPGRGIVHVDPIGPATIVDGSAESLADLGAFGALPSRAPIQYAGDLTTAALKRDAAAGANLVIGDSDRRQVFEPQYTQQNLGPTMSATSTISPGEAVIKPLPNIGSDGQTVSVVIGAKALYAPSAAGEMQFPEHAPIAAFDGDLSTAWFADRYLSTSNRWIEVVFNAPRNVPYVDVYPLSDTHGVVTEVDVNGIHHAVGLGWTRIPVHLHQVSAIRLKIDHVAEPKTGLGGPGGFRELRIPGLGTLRQVLRAPIIIGRNLAGANLEHDSLSYVFERIMGDDPFQRNPFDTLTADNAPQDRGDGEKQIDRAVFAPATRSYSVDAWIYPAVGTTDSTLDRLAGYTGPDVFESSNRFQDQPAYRASSAFTGHEGQGWIGFWDRPEAPTPWISWTSPRPLRITRLRVLPSTLPVRRPTVVQLNWPGGTTGPLPVASDGTVSLPAPARARTFRLTVQNAAFPVDATSRERAAKAVGIGALSVPGLAPVSIPAAGPLHATCGTVALTVGHRRVPLAPSGTVAQLDAGEPVRASECGSTRRTAMKAGLEEIRSLPGPFSVDLLRLTSPASAPSRPAVSGGQVLDPGRIGTSSLDGARVALKGPSWLVLGESLDKGWRASCDGRSLGPPQAVDGYANGWIAPASCKNAAFSFEPQNGVRTSYVVSAIVCFLLALLLVAGAARRPTMASAEASPTRLLPEYAPRGRSLPQAFALAILVAIPLGYVFAIRAGIVSVPFLTLVLWRGYGPRALALTAAALLGVVVPVLYLVVQPQDLHGYNFGYSSTLATYYVHWIGVAAIVLMGLAALKLTRKRR